MESVPRSFTLSFHCHQLFALLHQGRKSRDTPRKRGAPWSRTDQDRELGKVLEELPERSGPGNAGLEETGGKLGGD